MEVQDLKGKKELKVKAPKLVITRERNQLMGICNRDSLMVVPFLLFLQIQQVPAVSLEYFLQCSIKFLG